MNKKTVIFDLDGTLVDSLSDLTDGVNYCLSTTFSELEESKKRRTREEIRSFIGFGIRALIKRSLFSEMRRLVEQNDWLLDEAYKNFSDYYERNLTKKTVPYEGIMLLLRQLREDGFNIAVVSNKDDAQTSEICKRLFGGEGNEGYIDFCIGTKDFSDRKPSPFMIERCLSALSADKEGAIMIGDTEVDINAAKSAGIGMICVCWGFRSEETLRRSGAHKLAHDTKELYELIKKELQY